MDLTVVGFGGRPVRGGVGAKPMLVKEASSGRYALITGGLEPRWHDEAAVRESEARGLLTLLGTTHAYQDQGLVLYAHIDFVTPPTGTDEVMPSARIPAGELALDPPCESYFGVMTRAAIVAQLRGWERKLLTAAESVLMAEDETRVVRGRTALMESMRARYASSGVEASRSRAFELAWAAHMLMGRSTDALRDDALIEFSAADVRRIELAGLRLYCRAPADPVRRRGWRDGLPGSPLHLCADAQ